MRKLGRLVLARTLQGSTLYRYLVLFLILLVTPLVLSAQHIQGRLASVGGDTIFTANIMFKEAAQPNVVKEFVVAVKGSYKYTLRKSYDSLLIEVKCLGFQLQSRIIPSPVKEGKYEVDFVMQPDTRELQEVTVKAQRQFVEKGNDTLVYNTEAFKDGSERKVEDLLKKLPGIEVDNKTGNTKYKGRPVETVMLDGDNLFGKNYTLGTRSINIDIVEAVEAIENYNENFLLKGVDSGEKVALNLKLKKGVSDLSGNLDASGGFFTDGQAALLLHANTVAIANKMKSVATVAYNNVGANYAPSSFSPNQQQNHDITAERLLVAGTSVPMPDIPLVNINNQLFGNYNTMLRPTKRLSIRLNAYALHDRISSEQFAEHRYTLPADTFSTTDMISSIRKPINYRGEVDMKYNTSPKSLLEYKVKLSHERISEQVSMLQNRIMPFQADLQSRSALVQQQLTFTYKLKEERVLQMIAKHAYNSMPQELLHTPSVFDSLERSTQLSRFSRTFSSASAYLLGKRGNYRYVLETGMQNERLPYISVLSSGFEVPLSENNLTISRLSFHQAATLHWDIGDFRISPHYNLKYLWQQLDDRLSDNNIFAQDILFLPSLAVRYKINRTSSLEGKVLYDVKPNAARYFISNDVLLNARSVERNIPSLELSNVLSYSLLYFNNDLSRQFNSSIHLLYNRNQGDFFSRYDISMGLNRSEHFFMRLPAEQFSAQWYVEKGIDAIASFLKFEANYTSNSYYNTLDSITLRTNRANNLHSAVHQRSIFNAPVNFEHSLQWLYTQGKTDASERSISNQQFQYLFKLMLKPHKGVFLTLESDYLVPNSRQPQNNYWFLSSNMRICFTKLQLECNVMAANLLNVKAFEQVDVSDFMFSFYRTQILSRHIIIGLSWNL